MSTVCCTGSMSMETKKHFWSLGIDCQEVYEVQGYESPGANTVVTAPYNPCLRTLSLPEPIMF